MGYFTMARLGAPLGFQTEREPELSHYTLNSVTGSGHVKYQENPLGLFHVKKIRGWVGELFGRPPSPVFQSPSMNSAFIGS